MRAYIAAVNTSLGDEDPKPPPSLPPGGGVVTFRTCRPPKGGQQGGLEQARECIALPKLRALRHRLIHFIVLLIARLGAFPACHRRNLRCEECFCAIGQAERSHFATDDGTFRIVLLWSQQLVAVCDVMIAHMKSYNHLLKEQINFGNIRKYSIANIGPGADWFVILLLLDLGLHLIKVGAEINDGIDGWIGLGKKLHKLFHRNRIVSIDNDGATALAINKIAKKQEIVRLEKIQESTIKLADLSGMIHGNKGLSKEPYNYYIQSYCINNSDVYVIGIKSTGEVKIIKHFVFNYHGIEEKR